MGPDPQTIYRNHAREYHDLVTAEDCDQNLLPAIASLQDLEQARVLEVGVGTGRITRQLLDAGASVRGFDNAPAMLEVARDYLGPTDADRLDLGCADARELPVDDGWADLGIAGWVFGHFRYWMQDQWRAQIRAAIDEMNRGLCDGGVGLIIETLGTAETKPNPPAGLREYYDWLADTHGCQHTTIRTDYQFEDVGQAAETLGFFFGADLGDRVAAGGSARVPEVTGLWWWAA